MTRFGVVFLLVAGCASVEQTSAEDATALGVEVQRRTGQTPTAWQRSAEEAARAQAAARALLAEPLTEDAAIKVALLNNQQVHASHERLGIARAELMQAGLLANPVLDADAKFFSGGTEIELGLLQPFLDLFYRPLRRRVAAHEFAAVQAELTRDLVHLTFDVRRAFVQVHAARRLVAIQQQLRDLAAAKHELMQTLHAAGNVTDLQLTSERVALARARLDLAAAEQGQRQAREPLHVLLGVWGNDVDWTLAGDLPAQPESGLHLEHAEARAVAASLELAENRARIDAHAQRVGLQSWEGWFPGAGVGIAAKREADNGWGLGPALSLELPLFDGGGTRVAAEQASLRAALARHTQLAVLTRSAARTLRERCIAACQRQAFITGELLPAIARLVHETTQNYNAMQIGAFDVLQARAGEVESERDGLEALRDACLARLDLEELFAGVVDHPALVPRPPRVLGRASTTSAGH